MKRKIRVKFASIVKNKFLGWSLRSVQICLIAIVLFGISLNAKIIVPPVQTIRESPLTFVPSDYPVVGNIAPPNISAASYMVLDGESSVPILEFQPEIPRHPASLTKLMTALVVMDYYSLDSEMTVKRLVLVKDEAEMGLAAGDRLTVRDLLYGLLVPSGNDAAYALSDNFQGGIENFIYLMNKKARDLKLTNTHFVNQNGADQENHMSTAKDLLSLARVAVRNREIKQIVGTSGVTISNISGTKNYQIKNVNQLLGTVAGVDGVKTGFTDLAGQCLITSTTRNGHTIYTVVLGSSDRFSDSAKLINWAFSNTTWEKPRPPV